MITIRLKSLPVLIAGSLVIALLAGGLVPMSHASTTVQLRIEGSAATLFDGSVTVDDCTVTDTTNVTHTLSNVAACALVAAADQVGFTYEFQDFGFGLFLKKIGSDDTPADFSKSWGFFVSYDPASTGADTYQLQGGEDLLLAFSGYPGIPLRVTTPASTPAGTPVSLLVEKRVGDFDASFNWQGRWENAAGAQLHFDDEVVTVPDNGQVNKTFTDSGNVVVYATGDGFIPSARTTLQVNVVPSPSPTPSPTPLVSPTPTPSPVVTPTPTPSATASPSPTPSPTPTGSIAGISTTARKQAAERALAYLQNQQDGGGSIDGHVTSAWSAIAFGANGQAAGGIRKGGSSLLEALGAAPLNSATDVERQILAVRASGNNPAAFYGQNLVAKLKGYYHDSQIGEVALVNDDIFGVLALLAAGESVTSAAVERTVETIVSKQSDNGAWVGVDVTAAAIQALRAYQRQDGRVAVDGALARARGYLKLNQDEHGGFAGNSASTAWAAQAIVALGENPDDWKISGGATPWSALLRYQNANGGFGWKSNSDVSPFMTAYAATALLNAHWPVTNLAQASTPAVLSTGGESSPVPPSFVPARTAQVAGAQSPATSSPASTVGQSSLYQGAGGAALDGSVPPTEAITFGSPSPTIAPMQAPILPVTATDRTFALSLFGLANLGVGVTMARLFTKLNFF